MNRLLDVDTSGSVAKLVRGRTLLLLCFEPEEMKEFIVLPDIFRPIQGHVHSGSA